jgi:hypothetical protein
VEETPADGDSAGWRDVTDEERGIFSDRRSLLTHTAASMAKSYGGGVVLEPWEVEDIADDFELVMERTDECGEFVGIIESYLAEREERKRNPKPEKSYRDARGRLWLVLPLGKA